VSRKPSYEELQQRVKELEGEAAERERLERTSDVQMQELISIFDGISEPICVCDPESHELLYANAAVASFFGPDILGKKCYHVLQGLDEPCDFCTNPMIFGENLGNPYIWEFQNRLNGRWYRCIDKAIRWPDGRMVRYEIAIDIHDLKLAEEALLESEERYRRLTEAMTDYIYTVKTEEGRPVETVHGPACLRITGYTPDDFKVNPYLWIDMVHEEDRRAVEQQAADILSGAKVEPVEHRIIRKDGVMCWVRNSPVPYYDSQGKLLYYDGLLQDITERKLAELVLQESQARYKGIVTHTNNGVAVYKAVNDGEDFIFVDFNKAGEKIDKVKREDVIGESVQKVFPRVKDFGLFEVFQRVWKTGEPERFPVSLYKDDRIVGWRENFLYKLPSGEVVAVYSDETREKQAEEALRRANEELYNLTQQLEEKVLERTAQIEEKNKRLIAAERFAAMGKMANRIAHELRNSLTVVGGFAMRADAKTPENDPKKRYLTMIVDEVRILEKKVSDIIKIENEE
jgi:PAS domain S-box-containing protein